MTLADRILDQLKALKNASPQAPQIVTADAGGVTLALDVTASDALSCSFRELRLAAPTLDGAGLETLRQWAAALCARVTYLLEQMGPLEFDADGGQVLVRSNPPDRQADATRFYEVLLSSRGQGNFTLRRYCSTPGQPGREQVDLHVTHEVLRKLVGDLEQTLPA